MTIFERLTRAGTCVAALLMGGCILQFTGGDFQSFTLHFKLAQALPAGESTLIHSALQPHEVKVKGRWLRVSGMVTAPEGEQLPARVEAVVRVENEAGKRLQQIKLALAIDQDGGFSAFKKIKKNLPAGAVILVSAEPAARSLPTGTDVWLCVDVLENRGAAREDSGCASAPPGGGGEVEVVQVVDNAFEPLRLQIDPNTTVRWVLAGNDPTHTVTANSAGSFDSGFIFRTPGDSFEVFFGPETINQTFDYACVTHGPTSKMQGSVQVGENAPEPNDRY